jgi:hypothetical protein
VRDPVELYDSKTVPLLLEASRTLTEEDTLTLAYWDDERART